MAASCAMRASTAHRSDRSTERASRHDVHCERDDRKVVALVLRTDSRSDRVACDLSITSTHVMHYVDLRNRSRSQGGGHPRSARGPGAEGFSRENFCGGYSQGGPCSQRREHHSICEHYGSHVATMRGWQGRVLKYSMRRGPWRTKNHVRPIRATSRQRILVELPAFIDHPQRPAQ